MKHSAKVEKYSGTLRELARDIVNMRYDSFAEFYKYISEELLIDAKHDENLGHKKVSAKLKTISEKNSKLEKEILSLWEICERYMMK
jgi:hypothetical protein